MRKFLYAVLTLFVLLALYLFYTFYTSGYFREIENEFDGTILQKIAIPGVEDIEISRRDSFLILSPDDRAGRRDKNPQQGGLYFVDLRKQPFTPKLLTGDLKKTFYPHGISMIHLDSNAYKIIAINHVDEKHFLETFTLVGNRITNHETLTDPTMISPNDIIMVDENRFYFSNDHGSTTARGKMMEDYLRLKKSNVVYFDGETYREVAGGISYANGINIDPKRPLLYLASPTHFLVKVYEIGEKGDLKFIENIKCGTGVDNIEFDKDGTIWIGCHPSLLTFAAYAGGSIPISPSEIIKIDYRNKGDYTIEKVYEEDGSQMSAATVAVPYEQLIFVGNVMDPNFLVLQRN